MCEEILAKLRAHQTLGAFQGLTIFPEGHARALYQHGAINYDATGAIAADPDARETIRRIEEVKPIQL